MSQDNPDRPGSSMLGRVESQAGHHRHHHPGSEPGRSSAHLRFLTGLGQPPDGPLPTRGRSRLRTPIPPTQHLTNGDAGRGRGSHREVAQGAGRCRPGRRTRDHRLARGTRTPPGGVPVHHQPSPDPGLVTPEPKKRPKSSYIRFEAALPNETWQSDFTHYRLTTGTDVEILTWLDDCTRYALHVSAHRRVTGPIVKATFRETLTQHGIPASTLTDNGWSTPSA
jgi:transposase InsO family protein